MFPGVASRFQETFSGHLKIKILFSIWPYAVKINIQFYIALLIEILAEILKAFELGDKIDIG